MKRHFDLTEGLIIVPTRLWGPSLDAVVKFALDTGATYSLINRDIAFALGYDPDSISRQVQITTGSRIELISRFNIERIEALGQRRDNFTFLCHSLPPGAEIDGLLGLNFFRNKKLTIDFRLGLIDVE